jgi:hypothetical protein
MGLLARVRRVDVIRNGDEVERNSLATEVMAREVELEDMLRSSKAPE